MTSELHDSMSPDDSGDSGDFEQGLSSQEALADQALREFLDLRRNDPGVEFEAYLASQSEDLQDVLAAKYSAFIAAEAALGETAEIDRNAMRDIIEPLQRKPFSLLTESFDGGSSVAPDDAPDAQHILDELAEVGALSNRYESQGRIAKGGMGIIHRVWDRQLRRRLAMKVMRLPADDVSSLRKSDADKALAYSRALARFQDEALVAAQLDHPGILPVHDLGVRDDGRAYFTMKYVAGRRDMRRIFDLVERGQDNWNVNRAVGSILRVCEAVAYAHSKGVLHRDIKPSNIMVGDYGATYLLDWGLARRLHGERRSLGGDDDVAPYVASEVLTGKEGEFTLVDSWLFSMDGRVVGTPPYMSPEQARGDIDLVGVRSDIYSLGALLYHLLTSRMPYYEPDELPLPFTILMKVRQGPPPSVRELAPDAPPGLLQICERAMARLPEDRYSSAAEMAVDLEDYLEVISEAREEARWQEQRATTINAFLLKMLASGDPARAQGREVTVRQVLDEAAAGIEAGMAGLPLDEASLRNFIGTLYKELGHYEVALPHAEKAYEAFESMLGAHHPETMHAATDVALVYRITGRLAEAEELLGRVLRVQVEELGDTDPATLRTRDVLAETIRRGRGRLSEVEQLLREVALGREQRLGEDHLDSLTALNRLANVLSEQGGEDQLNEAERLLRRALSGLNRTVRERHPATLIAMNDLAALLQTRGRLEEAEARSRECWALQAEVLGEEHPETIMSMANLGYLLTCRGSLDEAEQVLGRALRLQKAVVGETNPDSWVMANNLAKTIQLQGRVDEARQILTDVVDQASKALRSDNWHAARFRHNLAACLTELGEGDAAEKQLLAAWAVLHRVLGKAHPMCRETGQALAQHYRSRGQAAEAARYVDDESEPPAAAAEGSAS